MYIPLYSLTFTHTHTTSLPANSLVSPYFSLSISFSLFVNRNHHHLVHFIFIVAFLLDMDIIGVTSSSTSSSRRLHHQ